MNTSSNCVNEPVADSSSRRKDRIRLRRRASLLDAASALASLGGNDSSSGPSSCIEERRFKEDDHHDGLNELLSMSATTPGLTVPLSSLQGDVPMTFPEKLMDVLANDQISDIITWLPHGKGFAILQKRRFASEVMPLYFKQSTKFASFTRKLNRWGFTRVQAGPHTGYYHPYFQRGNHLLCMQMHCLAIHTSSSKKSKGSNTCKSSSTRSLELSSPSPKYLPPPKDEGTKGKASFDSVLSLQRQLLDEAQSANASSVAGYTSGFDRVLERQQQLLRLRINRTTEISCQSSEPRDYPVQQQAETHSQDQMIGELPMRQSEMNEVELGDGIPSVLLNDHSNSTAPSLGSSISSLRLQAELHSAMQERLRWLQEYNRSVEFALKSRNRQLSEHR